MGLGGSKLTFTSNKIVPLVFQPKPKDESNKLRRKNSLYEAIVEYLDHLDEGENGIQELFDNAALAALVAQDKKEVADDPRIAGLNKIADEVRGGNMRALRAQVTNHFKTINRRFQGKHAQNTLLHLTTREAYLPMVRVIFDDSTRIPADREVPIYVNSKNQRGRTPLHLAFSPPHITYNGKRYGLEQGATKAKCVRPEGAQIESDWIKPGDIDTRRKVVQLLMSEGADYESRDIMDFAPLHYACLWGWDDCVQEFINFDADLASITSTGMTPLMMACSRGHLKVVKLLLEESNGESADLEATDAQGDTALLNAIRRGSYPVVLLLVESYGADVNVTNYNKETPLLAACALNHLDMINLLLDFNVDRDPSAFELLRGQVAVMIRARLKMEAGEDSDDDAPTKVRGDGVGAWVVYIEKKPGKKKTKKGTKEPVFYYNTVTRVSTRKKPPDYKRDMLHLPKKAMFGLHFYH